jgi:hypothetical protein
MIAARRRNSAAKVGTVATTLAATCLMARAAHAQQRDTDAPAAIAVGGASALAAETITPGSAGSMPPFTAPLPPSITLPAPLRVVPAVPPPEYGPLPSPWTAPRVIPERATPPMPRQLPNPELITQGTLVLRQALAEYDRRLGMGPTGAVLSAARRVAMGETATGSARFEVWVDRTGTIRRVALRDASGDVPGWQQYAQALRSTPIPAMRMGDTAQDAWMVIDVSAQNERSSGRRRLWDYGLSLSFDVADIGARTMRVVHTRTASELTF